MLQNVRESIVSVVNTIIASIIMIPAREYVVVRRRK